MIEVFFFELYNLTMTSWPIIIFAIFDSEYLKLRPASKESTKENKIVKNDSYNRAAKDDKNLYFMEHPNLYRIGIEK